ncbi:Leukotriene A-4 hydrolase [Grifola frondosa]|uniref:Leukotriene A-4 hydrolase n=1 Tax=Grifola frondosa TaxID=5627 RepID=A0A1C7MRC3_GRIFR|nr:Leukotriene A-4 hydrolase [Grifola frondosa]
MSLDPTTQSNYHEIVSEHVHFDWTVDYTRNIISGSATHTLTVKQEAVKEVILDTNGLQIDKVQLEDKPSSYELGPHHEVMGSALRIPLPTAPKTGSQVKVTVHYSTSKDSTALQWLEKEQTQGKAFPFLFSQCQPIYARCLAPLQDTPSAKITYTAKVASTLPILLSAIRVSPPSQGPAHDGQVIGRDVVTYTYKQPVPIPSYLIAISAGNVRYRAFPQVEGKAWTIGVWAEPELIDAAYWEFSEDIGRFLSTAERILPPYRFGVHGKCLSYILDSYPPCGRPHFGRRRRARTDTFVFGNGVTQANATHFWLNEGWTTYIERVLQQLLHNPAERGFSFLIGAKSLSDALKLYENKPKYQRLVIDFDKGEDPDDAYSTVPYEKGANFLLHLERMLGGLDVFLPYVKDYVSTFMGKSITTEDWKTHLYAYFEKHGGEQKIKALNSVKWDAWFHGEGLKLPVEMVYDTALARQAYALAERWDASRSVSDVSQLNFKDTDLLEFNSNQKIVFLERLQSYAALPPSHITLLGNLYRLSDTPNAEIRLRFYEVALLDPSSPIAKSLAPEAANWVVGNDGTGIIKGRMKFCRPVFRAVAKVDTQLAVKVFSGSKEGFHPIARRLIEKDLGLV